jgi:hypothetical protein
MASSSRDIKYWYLPVSKKMFWTNYTHSVTKELRRRVYSPGNAYSGRT